MDVLVHSELPKQNDTVFSSKNAIRFGMPAKLAHTNFTCKQRKQPPPFICDLIHGA